MHSTSTVRIRQCCLLTLNRQMIFQRSLAEQKPVLEHPVKEKIYMGTTDVDYMEVFRLAPSRKKEKSDLLEMD